jgi:hypothetical protein
VSHAESQNASAQVQQLREALLTGRGPGASQKEIAEHTRARPLLGAVPPPVERALVAGQAEHLRAGDPVTSRIARRQERHGKRRAALAGAGAALLARSAVAWFVRARRRDRGRAGRRAGKPVSGPLTGGSRPAPRDAARQLSPWR